MVQYTPNWKAKECARLLNKTQVEKCDFSLFTFPSGILSHFFPFQYVGFCTMWPVAAKGLLHVVAKVFGGL